MLGATPRLKAIIALYQEYDNPNPKQVSELTKLLQKNFSIQDRRNRSVHDCWYYETVKGKSVREQILSDKKAHRLERTYIEEDAQALNELFADIRKQIFKFREIFGRICFQHPTLLGMPLKEPT